MSTPTVLVSGGAGYIGSHVVLTLRDAGWRVVVVDDLSTGRGDVVAEQGATLEVGDVGDAALLADVIARHDIGAVVHLAGSVSAPESLEKPLLYYRNNTLKSATLIEACVAGGVRAFVFASTAAVYGNPDRNPVAEDAPARPLSPYGHSKLMTERILTDAGAAHGLPYVALRFFNVAGADPAGRAGARTRNATSLIKVACETAVGRRAGMAVFGTDYPTRDGTCVRDFIHVSDLALAHVRALEHLLEGGKSCVLNCGYGHGYSVRQIVDTVQRLNGRAFAVEEAPRRGGDPVEVVAATGRIRDVLGWRPRHDDLEQIVDHALAFERRLLGEADAEAPEHDRGPQPARHLRV